MDDGFKTDDLGKLQQWFFAARMARYAGAPDSSALYVWDMRLQKAFLEDIAHVEVLCVISSRIVSPLIACARRAIELGMTIRIATG